MLKTKHIKDGVALITVLNTIQTNRLLDQRGAGACGCNLISAGSLPLIDRQREIHLGHARWLLDATTAKTCQEHARLRHVGVAILLRLRLTLPVKQKQKR